MSSAEKETVLFKRGEENDSDAWDDSVLIKAYDEAISSMKARLAMENPNLFPSPSPGKKKKKKSKAKKKQNAIAKWKSGDRCQAMYSEDGEIYEARIMSINKAINACTVQYIGYGNEEEQLLSDLLPPYSITSSLQTDTASETESASQETSAVPEPPPPATPPPNKPKSKRSRSGLQNSPSKQMNGEAPPIGQIPQFPLFGHMPPPPMANVPHMPNMPNFPGLGATGPGSASPVFPGIPPPPPLFNQNMTDESEALYSMLISWYMSGYHTGLYQGLRQASSTSLGAASSNHKVPR